MLETLERLSQGAIYDPSVHGFFLIVGPYEGLSKIGDALGRTVDAGSWEYVQEHADCYEMVCILEDSGRGVVVIVPKTIPIDPELLRVCTQGIPL